MLIDFIKKITAVIFIILLSPAILVMYVAVKTTSKGPFIFRQRRMGKDRKPFFLYKIRTMVNGAERLKKGLIRFNETDGPVFKIRNDPRYTRVGKFLSHSGLDELPQLINIIKGEMDYVGPRPLPLSEAKRVPKKYHFRFTVLPGMTSPWIIEGAHKMSFKEWMSLDVEYSKNKSFIKDLIIFAKTTYVIMGLVKNKIFDHEEQPYIKNRRS